MQSGFSAQGPRPDLSSILQGNLYVCISLINFSPKRIARYAIAVLNVQQLLIYTRPTEYLLGWHQTSLPGVEQS